jgi:ketol-acid reductoisomerase
MDDYAGEWWLLMGSLRETSRAIYDRLVASGMNEHAAAECTQGMALAFAKLASGDQRPFRQTAHELGEWASLTYSVLCPDEQKASRS